MAEVAQPLLGCPCRFWKIIRWVTYRQPIVALWGYSIYTIILYVIVVVLGVMTVGLALLAWLMMRGHESSKYFKALAMVLQLMADVAFNVFYMSTLGERRGWRGCLRFLPACGAASTAAAACALTLVPPLRCPSPTRSPPQTTSCTLPRATGAAPRSCTLGSRMSSA